MRPLVFRAQRPGKRQFWLLGLLLVPIFILLLGAPAWASLIVGRVHGGFNHDQQIVGLTVNLVEYTMNGGRPEHTLIAVTQTDYLGEFSFDGLHDGTYVIATSQASALGYVDQTSPPFVLLDYKNNDMVLDGAQTLSGHVMNIAGQPLAFVDMPYYWDYGTPQEGRSSFRTAADGSFSVPGFPPARIKLQIGISPSTDLPTLPPGYLPQWYNDKPDEVSANVIDFTAGSQTGLTIVIQGTRTIMGHVTDSSGKPVANVRVEAHVVAGDAVRQMITAADGFYQLIGLPPVTFRLFANDQSGTFLSEWYQDRSSFSAADGVNLAGGDSTIDFSMSAAPTTTTSSTTTTTLPTTTTTTSSTTTSTLPSTTTTTQLSTSAFTDVGSSNPYYAAIQGLASLGIISGYDLGGGLKEFRPANDVLRAQFAKMVDGALGIEVTAGMSSPFTDLGSDVPGTFYPVEYVAAAYANGITQGITATTFGPFISIPRAQVVTMAVRALQHLRPGKLADPPAAYTSTWGVTFSAVHGENARIAEFNGLLAGLPLSGAASDPWAPMPRGEVAQVLWNVMRK